MKKRNNPSNNNIPAIPETASPPRISAAPANLPAFFLAANAEATRQPLGQPATTRRRIQPALSAIFDQNAAINQASINSATAANPSQQATLAIADYISSRPRDNAPPPVPPAAPYVNHPTTTLASNLISFSLFTSAQEEGQTDREYDTNEELEYRNSIF